jgi:hypothetical protein
MKNNRKRLAAAMGRAARNDGQLEIFIKDVLYSIMYKYLNKLSSSLTRPRRLHDPKHSKPRFIEMHAFGWQCVGRCPSRGTTGVAWGVRCNSTNAAASSS